MKKTGFWLLLIVLLLVACVAVMVVQSLNRESGTAKIWQNGELLRTIDLTAVDESYTFEVAGDTVTNVVEVERGRIRVTEADCPDQVCVHQGWISDSSAPVVCLPNGLVIEIVGADNGLDAVVQ